MWHDDSSASAAAEAHAAKVGTSSQIRRHSKMVGYAHQARMSSAWTGDRTSVFRSFRGQGTAINNVFVIDDATAERCESMRVAGGVARLRVPARCYLKEISAAPIGLGFDSSRGPSLWLIDG